MYNIYELNDKTLEDLKMIAIELGIDDEGRSKQQLIYDIIDHQVEHPEDFRKMKKESASAKEGGDKEAAPKKRGRKRKGETPENTEKKEVHNESEKPKETVNKESAAKEPVAEAPLPSEEPKMAKKRGRKPKAENAKTQEIIPFPNEEAPNNTDAAQPETLNLENEIKVKREKRPRISRDNKMVADLPAGTSGPMNDRNADHSIFTLQVRPTFDFQQELLWNGDALEVLEPLWLRQELAGTVKRMWNHYNTK